MATEKKPAAKKAAPAKKTATAIKKAAPATKKAAPAPVAKKAAPASKKTAAAAPAKVATPAAKKVGDSKPATPAPAAEPKFAFTQKKKDKKDKPAQSASVTPSAKPVDPARAAFLAALEKKKQGHGGAQAGVNNPDKAEAHKSGPDAARRMFQRRSGAS